jgi:hypothetical protein
MTLKNYIERYYGDKDYKEILTALLLGEIEINTIKKELDTSYKHYLDMLEEG